MVSVSKTYEYVNDLEVKDRHKNYVLKTARAREIVSNLPHPENVVRDIETVPDVDVDLLISTTDDLPDMIKRQIKTSENKNKFTKKSLLGLCMSGRGMPVEIFLHEHPMISRDPSGELFEEVVWHELVHGLEGVEMNKDGSFRRHMPWSYKLQQTMLSIDEQNDHDADMFADERVRPHISYLRSGTTLQENVSEVFARLAVIYMYEIKDTGLALTSAEDLFNLFSRHETAKRGTRKEINIFDSLRALRTFSEEAQQLFIQESDELVTHIARLYGCNTNKQ